MRGVTFTEFSGGQNVDMMMNAPMSIPGTPLQEAISTAKEIRSKFSKQLYVIQDYSVQHMYAQIAMQGFLMAGIDFVAAIPVLSNNLSKRENDCTIAYCKKRNIPYELFHIDVPNLFDNEIEYYAEHFPTTQPQMTIMGKFFDMLPDCCIVYPGFMMHVVTASGLEQRIMVLCLLCPTKRKRMLHRFLVKNILIFKNIMLICILVGCLHLVMVKY